MISNRAKIVNPLSDEQLRAYAPSIFAEHAAPMTSKRYQFMPTFNVVAGMRSNGWLPVAANEMRVRLADREGFQKHIVRFRHVDNFGKALEVNDYFPELVLMNAHDRSSLYKLTAGIYRLACSNGMVVADSTFETISVRHTGVNADEVINASYRVIEEMPKVTEQIGAWRRQLLTDGQQKAFAEAALLTRYESLDEAPIRPEIALRVHRSADADKSIWSTLNVLQENLTQGGQKDYLKRNAEGKTFKKMTTIKSIDENVRVNKALWHLADALSKLSTNN